VILKKKKDLRHEKGSTDQPTTVAVDVDVVESVESSRRKLFMAPLRLPTTSEFSYSLAPWSSRASSAIAALPRRQLSLMVITGELRDQASSPHRLTGEFEAC
jgi:hypothetical protein